MHFSRRSVMFVIVVLCHLPGSLAVTDDKASHLVADNPRYRPCDAAVKLSLLRASTHNCWWSVIVLMCF